MDFALFGTDGIRGPYGSWPITEEFAYILGMALAQRTRSIPLLIFTCTDSRRSGASLETALHSGILSGHARVMSCGVIPTPALAYEIIHQGGGGGVALTASHNPHTDNGFKLFDHRGHKYSASEEQELEQVIQSLWSQHNMDISTTSPLTTSSSTLYLDSLAQQLHLSAKQHHSIRPVNVVLDAAQGACSPLASTLFIDQNPWDNIRFILINHEPTGDNINHHCGAVHTTALSQAVLKHHADFGVAFDGDGDRVVVIDHLGQEVSGSALIAHMALWHQQTTKPTAGSCYKVGTTILANSGLDSFFKTHNIKLMRTEVGDRNLAHLMDTHSIDFAAEPSGHHLFRSHVMGGDSLYATIQILQFYISQIKHNPSFNWHDASQTIGLLTETTISVAVNHKVPLENMPHVVLAIQSATQTLRSSSQNGRVLWRYSGTENKLRIFVEGDHSKTHLDQIASSLADTSVQAIKQQLALKDKS